MLANNTFVPSSAALYFILEFIIAPRQSLGNNMFAFRQIREGRKEDGLAYLEFVSRHCTPSGTQRRNHIISESAGVLNTCRQLNDRMAVLLADKDFEPRL
jgi:hypothetical protein